MLKYLHEDSATGNDETHNPDIAPVDVGGWRFTSGANYDPVAAGHPGGRLPRAYGGQLDNGGETLALRLAAPFDENVLSFRYEDTWYPNTDGPGKSLTLRNTATGRDDFGDVSSWNESTETGGSPDGVTISTPTTYTQWLSFYATADGLDADRDGLQSLAEFGLGINPQSPAGNNGASRAPTDGVSADNRLQVSFLLPENAARPGGHGQNEVTYAVQVSTSPQPAAWTTIVTKTPATNWTGSATATIGTSSVGFVPVTIKDTVAIPSGARRFIRLMLTWTP